jgi:plastocyanin
VRRVVVLAVLVVALGTGGAGGLRRRVVAAPTVPRNVSVSDFSFGPETVVVQVGETVLWTNVTGGTKHTITADDGAFDSNEVRSQGIDGGLSYSHVFTQTGRHAYRCTLHSPGHPDMKGVVVVEPATTTAEQAPRAAGAGEHSSGKPPVGTIVAAAVVFVLLVAGSFAVGWRPSRRTRGS